MRKGAPVKPWRCIILALGILTLPVAAAEDRPADELFNAAGEAYDQGNHMEALNLYRQLIDQGHGTLDILYNGGNAAFRGEDIGTAVLMYRRAWYLSPRDPDVEANLRLAMERTGALLPSSSLWQSAFREFSHREWTVLFKAAYWITFVLAAGALLFPAWRRPLLRGVALAGLVTVVALSGWLGWRSWIRSGEAVVMPGDQSTRYEPRESATPYFAVPEGSLVHVEEKFESWVKISSGGRSGWIPADRIALVMADSANTARP